MKNVGKIAVLVTMVTLLSFQVSAQNYASQGNGNWTTVANWSNTSGWGTSTPPTDGSQGSGTITMNHNMSITGNYNSGSSTLNISAGKTLTINGNMTVGGGSTINISGNLVVTGNITLNGDFNILPGGSVTVNGSMFVVNSNYLTVGTNVAGPPYADLIIKTNLVQQSSGDVTVNRNGRVAVFGNVTDSNGGGTFLKVNNGGQMYVNGNVSYSGGGSDIINNNTVSPYGLYVNGTTSNTGGGATTTSNKGNKTTMQTTNPTFYSWVAAIPGSPLPVTLVFFNVNGVSESGVDLIWATASEKNFDYFLVESSQNGVDFSVVGRVNGHGNSEVRHDYAFTVANPVIGKTYFRLKSVDFDGYTETFNVVAASYEAAKSVAIFPNPIVDSHLNVNFNFDAQNVVVSFTDMTGMEVARYSVNGIENLLTLSLEPGTYVVKVSSTEVNTVMRVVVR